MAGLLAILAGKPKPKGDDDMPMKKPGMMGDDDAGDEGSESSFAREAFAALKDDDEQGFVDAFTSAVRACVKKSQAGEYGADDNDGDEG